VIEHIEKEEEQQTPAKPGGEASAREGAQQAGKEGESGDGGNEGKTNAQGVQEKEEKQTTTREEAGGHKQHTVYSSIAPEHDPSGGAGGSHGKVEARPTRDQQQALELLADATERRSSLDGQSSPRSEPQASQSPLANEQKVGDGTRTHTMACAHLTGPGL
jgi:hypothetical protein